MKIKHLYLLCFLFLVSCSMPPHITSFCDRTYLSEPAANYSVTYVKKPPPQFDASYWNLCGPAWTRGGGKESILGWCLQHAASDLESLRNDAYNDGNYDVA